MANIINQNPLILDTASTSAVVTAKGVVVSKIRWAGATTLDHAAVLQNRRGQTIWEDAVNAIGTPTATLVPAGESSFNPPLFVDGLIMHTLGSGKLYVYVNGIVPA